MKKLTLLLTLVFLIACCGCGEPQGPIEMLGTTCDNIVMCYGKFCFSNDFIYFIASDDTVGADRIYEYDLATGKAVGLRGTAERMENLFVSGDRIYYTSVDSLKSVTKSGRKSRTVFSREGEACRALTVYDNTAYFLDFVRGNLFSRNLESGSEQKLLSNVLSYSIDGGKIYAVVDENDHRDLYTSDLEPVDFQKVELDIQPIVVSANDDTVYLSAMATYQLHTFQDGQLAELPIRATYYTVLDGQILYLDAETFGNSCFNLTAYDTATGEKEAIFEDVFDFAVLENRYICAQCFGEGNRMNYYGYDRLTGERFTMLER